MYQPFLSDPVMQEIVNLYFEFQVGSVLITYMNNSQVLKCDQNDLIAKTKIRALKKGNIINEQLPSNTILDSDTTLNSLLAPLEYCSCSINIEQLDCKTARISGTCKNLLYADGDATLTIDVAKTIGTTGSHTEERVKGSYERIINVNPGFQKLPVRVNASIDPDCFTGTTKNVSLLVDPDALSCDSREMATPYLFYVKAHQAIRYRVSNYHNLLGFYYEDANQDSYQMKTNSTTVFENRNANLLQTTIVAQRKDGGNGCLSLDTERETKECRNCRDRNASVNTTQAKFPGQNKQKIAHCTGDVVGVFRKENNGITINIEKSLDYNCCK
jgi:hypothetical protein